MFLLRMLTRKRVREMDPLHVSMTGVRMGERFLQIGCRDRALLAGLAAKVGLSGSASVAALDAEDARNAASVGKKVGALIEIRQIDGGQWPYDDGQFDMIVVDDTHGTFARREHQSETLANAHRALRPGGRIEIIARPKADAPSDLERALAAAHFRPVRTLAERDGFRFVEGLRPVAGSVDATGKS